MASNNPRPRKYASDAERQAAYRERYAVLSVRLKPETAATLERISEALDIPRADVVADLIAFALANRPDMHIRGLYSRSIVSKPQARRVATKYTLRDTAQDSSED